MSLLLDALKKAAEQKAAKSKQEEIPAATPSDETEITAAAEDISGLEQGAGRGSRQSGPAGEDETELDTSEVRTRLERTQIEGENVADTEIEVSEPTQTRSSSLSSQMQSGEDDTIIFAEEDVSDFLGEPELVQREPKSHDDATDLDQTEYQTRHDAGDVGRAGDDTEMDQTEYQTRHEAGDVGRAGDDTEMDQTEYQTRHEAGDAGRAGDDTEMDQTEYQTHHDAGDAGRAGDDTEMDQTEHQTRRDVEDAGRVSDDTQKQPDPIQDEDMSLLLVDHDDTNLTARTSLTDPQTPDYAQLTSSDDATVEELALVDKTQLRLPGDITETAAETQTNATTRNTSATQTTSTHTYAPDNYDRTLMQLPSDDASKIFAGMKSDADVVMTPDYAKKVFRSKSSAQRMQAYRVYVGIALVILFSTVIYGVFEYQSESGNIDNSLRPLKRDPMPGIIKAEDIKQDTDLFAESADSARTIEIIENADNAAEIVAVDEGLITDEEVITDGGIVADQGEIAAETMSSEDVASEATTAETDSSAVITGSVATAQTEPVETTEIAGITQAERDATRSESNSSNLEIISSSQVSKKDLWLREAYAAYKSGNDSQAMTRYNQVLEIDPGNRNALLARAAINVQNRNANAAIRDYQTLLLNNPKDSLAMTSLIAVANYSPAETESQLKLMIRDEPDSPYLNFALANAYGAQNRWQEAQAYYFKALQNNPGDPNYAYNLAVSLEHIAQPGAAVAYYQRALANIDNGLATFNREIVSQRVETLAKQ
jgi:tetratricopeptide (TPR) repeat protein